MIAAQTKHTSEIAARVAARTLGSRICQIVESREVTKREVKKGTSTTVTWERGNVPVFYLEHGDRIGMVRNWESVIYEGEGNAA